MARVTLPPPIRPSGLHNETLIQRMLDECVRLSREVPEGATEAKEKLANIHRRLRGESLSREEQAKLNLELVELLSTVDQASANHVPADDVLERPVKERPVKVRIAGGSLEAEKAGLVQRRYLALSDGPSGKSMGRLDLGLLTDGQVATLADYIDNMSDDNLRNAFEAQRHSKAELNDAVANVLENGFSAEFLRIGASQLLEPGLLQPGAREVFGVIVGAAMAGLDLKSAIEGFFDKRCTVADRILRVARLGTDAWLFLEPTFGFLASLALTAINYIRKGGEKPYSAEVDLYEAFDRRITAPDETAAQLLVEAGVRGPAPRAIVS